jgi:uncharacterized protein (DUF488 family)
MSQTNQSRIKLYTIGFTQKSAEVFFTALIKAGVKRVIDVRLNNASQLAAFAKQNDLAYFLKVIGGMDYVHYPSWAPPQELLDGYREKEITWNKYEKIFCGVIRDRKIEAGVLGELLGDSCLLCSEAKPDYCHRRLVAEYFSEKFGNIEICHLF